MSFIQISWYVWIRWSGARQCGVLKVTVDQWQKWMKCRRDCLGRGGGCIYFLLLPEVLCWRSCSSLCFSIIFVYSVQLLNLVGQEHLLCPWLVNIAISFDFHEFLWKNVSGGSFYTIIACFSWYLQFDINANIKMLKLAY